MSYKFGGVLTNTCRKISKFNFRVRRLKMNNKPVKEIWENKHKNLCKRSEDQVN